MNFKTKAILSISFVAVLSGLIGLAKHKYDQKLTVQVETRLLANLAQKESLKNKEDNDLYTFIVKVMDKVKANISPSKKDLLIGKIQGVANKFFDTLEKRQAFVIVVSIESKFKQESKSSVGAVGISQIMPQYFVEFAKSCGLEFVAADINDIDANLAVGACHFNALVNETGSVLLAVAAYNSGLHSSTVKSLKKLGTINNETSNYVARFALVKESVNGTSN
jgi:hypothetical protein